MKFSRFVKVQKGTYKTQLKVCITFYSDDDPENLGGNPRLPLHLGDAVRLTIETGTTKFVPDESEKQ